MSYASYFEQDFFSGLKQALPPVFTRKTASEMTGGLFSAKALSNLDAAGKGPAMKLMSGKSILYEKNSFIDWLQSTIKPKKEILNRPSSRHVHDSINDDEVLENLYPRRFQHTF